jgi:hypothetical protein
MTTLEPLDQRVRAFLKNLELKLVLDSPNQDYRFEYYTTTTKDDKTGELRYMRTYRLMDQVRGGVTQEPWDSYDLEKQTNLVTNLIEFGRYKLSKLVAGWSIKCPSCGYLIRGKHWEPVPKQCTAPGSPKCRQRFESNEFFEEIHVDQAK